MGEVLQGKSGFLAHDFHGPGLDAIQQPEGRCGSAHPERAAVLHARPDEGLVDGAQGGPREERLCSAEQGHRSACMRGGLADVGRPGEGGGDCEADHLDGGAFGEPSATEEDGGVWVLREAVLEQRLGCFWLRGLAGPAAAGDDRGCGGGRDVEEDWGVVPESRAVLLAREGEEVRLGQVEGHEPCQGPGVDALRIALEGGGSWSAVRGGFDCGPQYGTVRLPSSANKSSEVVGHIVNEDEKEDGPENAALGHACGYVAV